MILRSVLYGVLVSASLLSAGCGTLNWCGDRHSVDGSVYHVVICWLKEPGNEEARERLIDASKGFTAIPGVVSVVAGKVLPDDRPVVDNSFDVAVFMTFSDEAALRSYQSDPIHQNAIRETLTPLVRRILVYDFTE